ncbi:hypothetical protein GALL_243490 [mine drainage metagenome]|uniref:Uncharacterized protein n=1 Tax=mine drainage metagenome TaxID=410659 RepID=A0A1J5RNL0_9ZZZZ
MITFALGKLNMQCSHDYSAHLAKSPAFQAGRRGAGDGGKQPVGSLWEGVYVITNFSGMTGGQPALCCGAHIGGLG